jgi:hypothetical protein
LREVIGSWKIIEISLPRIVAISSSVSVARSRPSNTIDEPRSTRPGRSISRMIERAVTDLPLPDSPTTPSVPPFSIEKSTPSTARITPPWVWKEVRRSLTVSSSLMRCPSS